MIFAQAQAYLLGTINETASRRLPNRLDRMRASRAASFDFALEMAAQIRPVVGELGVLARHSFEVMTRLSQAVSDAD